MFIFFFFYFSFFPKKYINYILAYTVILSIFFLTNKLLLFYITFEISIIPIFIIILGWGNQPERIIATNYLTIYTISFSLPLLLILLYIINFMYRSWEIKYNFICNNIFWLIIILPFLIKIPIYIFHLWLPKAHVEAPVIGRIFLARILLKTGRFGLIKINDMTPKTINNYIITLSLILRIIARLICMIQSDLKKFVAYSRVAHMTIIISLIRINSNYLFNGIIILMISHAIIRNIIFFITGYFRNNSKSRIIYFQQNQLYIIPIIWFTLMLIYFFNSRLPPALRIIREFMIFINSLMIWNGNIILSLILFIFLTYYSIWFLSIFNFKKSLMNFYSWTLISEIIISIFHCLFYIIFWFNLNILL